MKMYDPNIRWGHHTVEITYQQWDFTLTAQVEVNGNCKGLTILKTAVGTHADKLFEEQGDFPTIVLSKNGGADTLEVTLGEDMNDIESDLETLCVGLSVTAFVEGGAA